MDSNNHRINHNHFWNRIYDNEVPFKYQHARKQEQRNHPIGSNPHRMGLRKESLGDCSNCCSKSVPFGYTMELGLPSTFGTLLQAYNRSHYSTIKKAFRTNIHWPVTQRADIFMIQITDAGDGSAGRTFNGMVVTKLVSTTVTPDFCFFTAYCTIPRHLNRPKDKR